MDRYTVRTTIAFGVRMGGSGSSMSNPNTLRQSRKLAEIHANFVYGESGGDPVWVYPVDVADASQYIGQQR